MKGVLTASSILFGFWIVIIEKKHVEFEDYKNMLQPVFGDKLPVRLAREREKNHYGRHKRS